MDQTLDTLGWVVPWAIWIWAVLIGLMVVFELFTLWWNRKYGEHGQRANLSAYVSAFFRAGDRRLKYSAGASVLIALFVFFLGHFLNWWG